MVRVRFAPSPTGYVHVGSLRTALYCYLFAHHHAGRYILRIEDTDQSRLVEGAVENLLVEMDWTGVRHDEGPVYRDGELTETGDYGPYTQSHRLPIYQQYVKELLEKEKAYYCFCSKERLDALREEGHHGYDGHCRDLDPQEAKQRVEAGEEHVVRLKMPKDTDLVFQDLVRGGIVMNSDDSDDQVLQKSDGFPTYHMAVVVDDHLMGITHVIRGEEWVSSTPKHLVLYDYLGWEKPYYAHLPNILNVHRKKLSKREGDAAVSDFREKGYLPEALVNFLALVGWNPGDEREIMSMEEMIEAFSFERVSKSGGIFDVDKLNHINNHYIRKADNERLYDLVKEHVELGQFVEDKEKIIAIIDLVKEKVDRVIDLAPYIEEFYQDEVEFEEGTASIIEQEHVPELWSFFAKKLDELDPFDEEGIQASIKACQKELGVKGKQLFMPLRIGVSGTTHGSDLVKTIALLGKERVLKRLARAGERR